MPNHKRVLSIGTEGTQNRPTREQMALYRPEILRRIEQDRLASRYLHKLTLEFGFSADEVVHDLLNHIFYQAIGTRERLLASPFLSDRVREHLKYPSPGDWRQDNPNPDLSIGVNARELADCIERSERDTPAFGLDELESMQSRTTEERELASDALLAIPATLRLYAEYFEKSRKRWDILGQVEIEAKEQFQKVVRHRGQEAIRTKTGHYSDDRYHRLLNIALSVVGQPEIDRNTLTMRRTRRRSMRFKPPKPVTSSLKINSRCD
jgi:hypothetical protein